MSNHIPFICAIAMYLIGVINGYILGHERGYDEGYNIVAKEIE